MYKEGRNFLAQLLLYLEEMGWVGNRNSIICYLDWVAC